MDGWRIDVGYPEDRDEAERRLQDAGASLAWVIVSLALCLARWN